MFKWTIADSSVNYHALYFNAYQVDGESVQRVARTGYDKADYRIRPSFNNRYPYLHGYYSFSFSQFSKVDNGFFEVEMHIDSSKVITKRFGEIKGMFTRSEYELFVKEDSVITAY